MTTQNVGINFTGNVEPLLDSLHTAKAAINDTFDATTMFRTLERSSDQAIARMIRGTENWQRALYNVATSLEIRFAQMVSHRVLDWLQGELFMTSATREAGAVRAAAEQESSSMGLASRAQHAISALLNSAREVFGGIFAFLSPTMGPAAAGPAAAGSASVSALASGITFAEAGAWHIPGNTLAYLHAGEMVVPKPFADSLRDAGGLGGGASYSITIQAIDTQTGAQFLKNNAAAIASAISGQARNFNRNVPAWKG